jgi:hypothetical protein
MRWWKKAPADDLAPLRATVRALERRVAMLEHFEHDHCPPDVPCPKAKAA